MMTSLQVVKAVHKDLTEAYGKEYADEQVDLLITLKEGQHRTWHR